MKSILATLALVTVALSGCATTEPTRFYLLSAGANPALEANSPKKSDLTVVIDPIRLPEYLNRSQIVTRVSDNELQLGQQDRWAESLERTFTRILAQNLEGLLFCRCVSALAPRLPPGITHRVEVDVIRMDGILGQKVFLDIRWSVSTPEKKLLLSRKSSFVELVKGSGYEAFVRAQSAALFDFSREVAKAILELQSMEAPDRKETVRSR
ncbi:MAG TPA: hypothetical protein DCR97_07005 [Deltaproteobacteria bacterium]|nr:hypothetical protein [Deltaproteobacteria bacterium]